LVIWWVGPSLRGVVLAASWSDWLGLGVGGGGEVDGVGFCRQNKKKKKQGWEGPAAGIMRLGGWAADLQAAHLA